MEKTWLEVAVYGRWGQDRKPGVPITVDGCIEQGVACVKAGIWTQRPPPRPHYPPPITRPGTFERWRTTVEAGDGLTPVGNFGGPLVQTVFQIPEDHHVL